LNSREFKEKKHGKDAEPQAYTCSPASLPTAPMLGKPSCTRRMAQKCFLKTVLAGMPMQPSNELNSKQEGGKKTSATKETNSRRRVFLAGTTLQFRAWRNQRSVLVI